MRGGREPGGATAERIGPGRPRTLLSQPLLAAPLQPALQEAAEAAEHDDGGPHQPEAGETGQEGVGAVRHHHGDDGTSFLQTAEPLTVWSSQKPQHISCFRGRAKT